MTTAVDNFNAQIDRIRWPVIQHGQLVDRPTNTVPEAKLYQREVSGIQTQLRSLKKDVNLYKKQVRLSFGNAQTNASNHPILGMIAGRKAANHLRAQDKQRLRGREHNALLPYEAVIDRIDRCLLTLDKVKLEIDRMVQSGQITQR